MDQDIRGQGKRDNNRGQEPTNVVIAVGMSPGKGRGVFAQERIGEGQVIDAGPVVIVPPHEIAWLKKTILANYYFVWGNNGDAAAILLSRCSLCNHSDQANASFALDPTTLTIGFVARRDIESGEEITIDYRQGDELPATGPTSSPPTASLPPPSRTPAG